MPKRSQKEQKTQTELSEFVIVTLTNDQEQANEGAPVAAVVAVAAVVV